MPTRLIIDTDTAGDDVVSLLIGLLHPALQLEAITICAGNVAFDQEVENALYTVEKAGRSGEVPVYAGCRQPLIGPWISADYVHGQDGMGNSHFPRARQRPAAGHAVDCLVERINAAPGELTLLAQAPLTNLAAAVVKDPSIAGKLKAVYIMGGTYQHPGNITPAAEYNFYVDPEAARIVFKAGFPIHMVDWGICVKHSVCSEQRLAQVAGLETELSRFFLDVNRAALAFSQRVKIPGTTHPDSIVCAMIADPAIATRWRACHVDIETGGVLSRGASIVYPVDIPGVEGWADHAANAMVLEAADSERFYALLLQILGHH